MARIAIDCDGVLANFTKAFIEAINGIWPGRLSLDFKPTDWDWTNSGLTKSEINKVWKKIKRTEGWWLSLDAFPGLPELAQWLVTQTNHDVWVCTARAELVGMTAAKQTEIWLSSCGVRGVNNFLGIITVPDGNDKAQLYEAVGIEWSLDDKVETVIDCGLIDTFEHQAYLLNQPWNAWASVHNRVSSVGEFLRKIK